MRGVNADASETHTHFTGFATPKLAHASIGDPVQP